jgi:hypothetical protein
LHSSASDSLARGASGSPAKITRLHWVVGKRPGRSEGVCETMTDSLETSGANPGRPIKERR